jgi:ribonuclease R
MARHVGRVLSGTVSGVDRWGFWVELDVAYVEGFVHVGKLDEYFDYVPERMELQSRVSPAVVRIGQSLKVRVASVDLAARRIELELATSRGERPEAPRTARDHEGRPPKRPERERSSKRRR